MMMMMMMMICRVSEANLRNVAEAKLDSVAALLAVPESRLRERALRRGKNLCGQSMRATQCTLQSDDVERRTEAAKTEQKQRKQNRSSESGTEAAKTEQKLRKQNRSNEPLLVYTACTRIAPLSAANPSCSR
eukprot:3841902-Rhodomonas_salina.1